MNQTNHLIPHIITSLLLSGLMPLMAGCEENVTGDDIVLPYKREIVVQGYMTAGQVDTILITQTLPPLAILTVEQSAIVDADVHITSEGVELPVRHVGEGKYVPGGWVPEGGKSYAITVESEGDRVEGVAQVPPVADRNPYLYIDTQKNRCSQYDSDLRGTREFDSYDVRLRYITSDSIRFSLIYDLFLTYDNQGSNYVGDYRMLRPRRYRYRSDTAEIRLNDRCDREQNIGRMKFRSFDSLYIRLYEYEPGFSLFQDSFDDDDDHEFFGTSGSEPEWNVAGDGFGLFYGRTMMIDTLYFR